jgi:hypothetical protein
MAGRSSHQPLRLDGLGLRGFDASRYLRVGPVGCSRLAGGCERRAAASAFVVTALVAVLAVAVAVGARHASSTTPAWDHAPVSGAYAANRLESLPAGGQAAISRTLGSRNPSFNARPTPFGWSFRGAGLSASFVSTSATIATARGTVSWAPASLRFGRSVLTFGGARPHGDANRVSYWYRGLGAWYVMGPLGIEQGFTLTPRSAPRTGPVTLSLRMSGTLSPHLVAGGLAMRDTAGATVLRYRALEVRDAHGRLLPSSLALSERQLLIRIEASGAAYPLRVDPLIQPASLTATDDPSLSPTSVAIDGSTVAVGAPAATRGSNAGQGVVYVFQEPAGGWSSETQTAELIASDGAASDGFGASVAIEGSTIVAGAPQATIGSHSGAGAVYVFAQPTGGWSGVLHETAKLTASDGVTDDRLGTSVALSGQVIAAGGAFSQFGNSGSTNGAVYVFTKPSGGWATETQTAKLSAARGAGAVGAAVAVSGSDIFAGAPGLNGSPGAVYVFAQPSGGWANETEAAKLTAPDPGGLGTSLAISGSTLFAGAPLADTDRGVVYVFDEPNGGWSNEGPTATLSASHTARECNYSGSCEGFGVSVTASESTALVADAPSTKRNGPDNANPGRIYAFSEPPTGWSGTFAASPEPNALTAARTGALQQVAIDGSTALVGGVTSVGVYNNVAAPAASIASPLDRATYIQGQRVLARYTCREGAGGPGLKSCIGSVRNGHAIDTSMPGDHSFTVIAASKDGARVSQMIRYTVAGYVASRVSRSGLTTGAPRVAFVLRGFAGAPKITSITVHLPQGLRFSSRPGDLSKGVVLSRTSHVRLKRGLLVLRLGTAVREIAVHLKSPALRETPSLRHRIERTVLFNRGHPRAKRHLALRMRMTVMNATGRPATMGFTIDIG